MEYPHVVITDFGCALSGNLEVQYPGPDAIAGNLALMAPEVELLHLQHCHNAFCSLEFSYFHLYLFQFRQRPFHQVFQGSRLG